MPKRKRRRDERDVTVRATRTTVHVQWVYVALLAGLVIGGTIGYVVGDTVPSGEASATIDRYGRSPGDPHYGHDHP